jgi:hypothetical protein
MKCTTCQIRDAEPGIDNVYSLAYGLAFKPYCRLCRALEVAIFQQHTGQLPKRNKEVDTTCIVCKDPTDDVVRTPYGKRLNVCASCRTKPKSKTSFFTGKTNDEI